MTAALIIAFLLIAAAAFAAYRRQRALPENESSYSIDPPRFRSLFDSIDSQDDDAEKNARLQKRADLILRAAIGDMETLTEAHQTGDVSLYVETLDALTSWAEQRQENLSILVSRIAKNEGLRASARLAELMIEEWKISPARRTTIEMMHIATLTGDAAVFQKAVETVVEFHREGSLPQLGAKELGNMIEAEYWSLDSEARRSGAGFALKQRLAEIRRELAHNSLSSLESLSSPESLKSGKGVKHSDSQNSPDSIDSQDS